MQRRSNQNAMLEGHEDISEEELQVAEYIAELLKELELMAGRRGLVSLQYAIIIAREEAEKTGY